MAQVRLEPQESVVTYRLAIRGTEVEITDLKATLQQVIQQGGSTLPPEHIARQLLQCLEQHFQTTTTPGGR